MLSLICGAFVLFYLVALMFGLWLVLVLGLAIKPKTKKRVIKRVIKVRKLTPYGQELHKKRGG